jgi:hypothetical protein
MPSKHWQRAPFYRFNSHSVPCGAFEIERFGTLQMGTLFARPRANLGPGAAAREPLVRVRRRRWRRRPLGPTPPARGAARHRHGGSPVTRRPAKDLFAFESFAFRSPSARRGAARHRLRACEVAPGLSRPAVAERIVCSCRQSVAACSCVRSQLGGGVCVGRDGVCVGGAWEGGEGGRALTATPRCPRRPRPRRTASSSLSSPTPPAADAPTPPPPLRRMKASRRAPPRATPPQQEQQQQEQE